MYGTLALFALSLGQPILRTEWDILFTGYTPSPEWGQALWLLRWGLSETIVIVDDIPVPAVEINSPGFWAGLVDWLADPENSCDLGCPELSFNRVPH